MQNIRMTCVAIVAGLVISGGACAAEHTVDQKGKKFSTTSISVKSGDRINFSNSDKTAHHVFSDKTFSFDSGRIPAGRSFTQLFDRAGNFNVRCKIHPKMKLAVTVQ